MTEVIYLTNDSKQCRVCCGAKDLTSLLQPNSSLIKKLRACADVSVESEDALPKWLCGVCSQTLDMAYNFKIQCEFMDRKLRDVFTLMKMDASSIVDNIIEVEETEVIEQMDDFTVFTDVCTENSIDYTELDEIMYSEGNHELFDEQILLSKSPIDNEMELEAEQKIERPNNSVIEIIEQQIFPPQSQIDPELNMLTENSVFTSIPEESLYQCPTCNRIFKKRYHLKNHQKTHTGLKSHACSLCSNKYTNQGNLDRHIRATHRNERQHSCLICSKSFSQATLLKQHQSVHITQRNFSCDCGKAFKTEAYLKLHKLRHLPKEQRPKRKYMPTNRKYKRPKRICVCTECGKQSNSLALHRSHMTTHTQEKKFECFCGKRFSFRQSLRNHLLSGEKKYKCDTCNLSFRQIGHLQSHKLTHTGEKKFECKFCLKRFAMRGNLTVHIKTHMNPNDLPYHCSQCPKKFNDINDLKRHQLSHNAKAEQAHFETCTNISAASESFMLDNSPSDQVKSKVYLPAESFNI